MKKLKSVLLLLCCLGVAVSCMGLAFAYTAFQTPTVLYNGRDHTLTLLNTQGTDLLPDMKDLMPGDVRTQQITLQARELDGEATIWLRADCDDDTLQALSQVTLSVYSQDRLVATGPAAGGYALENGVELGQFSRSSTIPLRVELAVSAQAGNELAGLQEHLRWIFTVQDTSGSRPVVPQTGDPAHPIVWWLLLLGSAGCLTILVLGEQKKKARTK